LIRALIGLSARHPWRMFFAAWLLAQVAMFLLSLLGTVRTPGNSYTTAAVPYRDLLANGPPGLAEQIGVPIDQLPAEDASLASFFHRPDIVLDSAGRPRIVGMQWNDFIGAGWNGMWWSCGSIDSLDLTMPREPFPPNLEHFTTSLDLFQPRMGLGVAVNGGSRLLKYEMYLPGALVLVSVPLAGSLLIVSLPGALSRANERRHRARGACGACGHIQDPARASDRCPECGVSAPLTGPLRTRSLRSRLIMVIVLSPLFVLVMASLVYAPRGVSKPLQAEIDSTNAIAQAQSRAFTRGIHTYERAFGWPRPFLQIQEDCWIQFAPDKEPAPAQAQRRGWRLSSDWLDIHWLRDGGQRTILFSLEWGQALWNLTVFSIGAVLLLIILSRVIWRPLRE